VIWPRALSPWWLGVLIAAAVAGERLHAHDGPPFPIVSEQTAGAYVVSVWTDPDTTDDGTAGGQFWVLLRPVAPATTLPVQTRARVTIAPVDRQGDVRVGVATPVNDDPGRQFVALVMDHEGLFSVRAVVEGPLGQVSVESQVAATYDARPAPILLALYLVPFLLVGALWLRLLRKRGRRPTGTKARLPGADRH
jgi:hypothetical protein